jgi:hypothetical protein
VPGGVYLVACRALQGASNTYAKLCFNHFAASVCDHSLVNNTGVYPNVCASFKVGYRGNATNYVIQVNEATQNGVNLNVSPWSYTTPTSSQIVSRVGYFLPYNLSGSPISYDLSVDVVYSLADAAGNWVNFTARNGDHCQLVLNSENPVALRSTDRCPTAKSINSSVSTDRQICGAIRYEWRFTKVLPFAEPTVSVEGPLNSNALPLNTVPGMAGGCTYQVQVRPIFEAGVVGNWGLSYCMKTTASGMILEPEGDVLSAIEGDMQVVVYPNPGVSGQFTINVDQVLNGKIQIDMFDVLGNLVYQTGNVVEKTNLVNVDVKNDLSNGMYLIKFRYNGEENSVRWIKN